MILLELITAIKTRRSIRKWKSKEVSDDLLLKVIEAGIHAPSSHNSQPWHFIIVRDKEAKRRIAETRPEINRWEEFAPVLISVCVDLEHSPVRWIEDGAAATENILLAAHDLGLGAVWFSGARGYEDAASETESAIRQELKLPENVRPVANIAIGFPNQIPKEKRLVELNSIVHKNSFDISKRRPVKNSSLIKK